MQGRTRMALGRTLIAVLVLNGFVGLAPAPMVVQAQQ